MAVGHLHVRDIILRLNGILFNGLERVEAANPNHPRIAIRKFLSALLISVVGGWLVCVAGWWLAEYLNYWLFSMLTPYGKIFRPDELGPLFNGYQPTFLSMLIFIPLFLQSLFFLGSTVWPRLSFPKTFWAASLILVAMLFTLKAGFSIGFDILGRTGDTTDVPDGRAHLRIPIIGTHSDELCHCLCTLAGNRCCTPMVTGNHDKKD